MTYIGLPNSLYRAIVKSYQYRRSARDSRDTRGERYSRQDRKEPRDTQRDKLQ